MLPMLGLFSVIYRDSSGCDQLQRSTMSGAYENIAPRLETLFPKTFEWVYEAPDGRRLTEELPLFGDLVDAAKYVVDLETAKDDDPIFKRAVPMFEPGTHARRKTHHQLRLLGRSHTPDAAKERSRNMLSFQRTRSGTNWMKGKSFKRLAHTGHLKRSDSRTLSPGSSPASTHSSVDLRRQHRGAFFRASVANLDA